MTSNYPGGPEHNQAPYTPPSTGHVTPGYFSPATPPPSFETVPVQEPAAESFQQQGQHQYAQGFLSSQRGNVTGPVAALKSYLGQYAGFSGRSTRSQFWWVQLFHVVLFMLVMGLIVATDDSGASALAGFIAVIYALFALALVVPSLALSVRRLHDANMSGGFLALGLIPYVGGMVLWILACLPSSPQGARFDKMAYQLPSSQPQGNYPQQGR
ncbi:DUF805 domain-containing protein [Arthrobacter sp. Sr24]